MPDTLLLQVVSPERQLVEEQVADVHVPHSMVSSEFCQAMPSCSRF